jgi:enoyl-CoA hydratase/carnithine racemase
VSPTDELGVERDGHVVVLTLNRPERLNALSQTLSARLEQIWPELDADPEVRVVVMTGAGERAFCTGADVVELSGRATKRRADEHYPLLTARWNRVYKPVIVAVNGICAGAGLHFVADADIVLCSENAQFLDTHANVGQVAALEPVALARRMPLGAVLRMIVLGRQERIDARRALDLGLVSEVLTSDALLPRAVELAHIAAKSSPRALQLSLQAIWEGLDRGLHDSIEHGWEIVKSHWSHPDAAEGPRAFAEKREPRWTP